MATDTKPKARLPRGLVDRTGAELVATRAMLEKIRAVYELYGFEALETPAIEYTDALGKFLPDQDRPNEGVFSFQDDDDQWLSLRYDLTAPLARYVAEHFDALPKPYRSYRNGYVFRNEKPGPGRFRQFMQFDADTVGAPSVAADAEICMMAADTLDAVGIARGDYVIKINNRKVLDGVLEAIGLGGAENAGRRLTVLRAIDKLDKIGPAGVRDLLGAGRWENPEAKSGDFTKGAGLESAAIDRVIAFVEAGTGTAGLAKLDAVVGESEAGKAGLAELREIAALVAAAGYDDGRIVIDPSVVRGLEYYTGPVYEAELTFEVKDEKGRPVRFGSVAGGGRYDGLVARFRGEPVPATGFSIGVSRLLHALAHLGKMETLAEIGPVVVLVMDRDRAADYMAMVAKLRANGIRAEMYLGGSGMKAQMKYADKRNAPAVIIQGSNEKDAGEVQIKDLVEGARIAADIADHAEYRAARPAQFSVKEEEMVEAIRGVLERRAAPSLGLDD
ncbi:histidyl-tRNA synthetase [Azorhizobium caulinodans ORS 571]|uniref:Histidine--tRNA ligase n=1 Tax=Azorhizobium caulinodans (strain ATCC 43989 / DSM 5975 / JCM 20966 / LMG 6465 / NBRC 14845 / NCIMB 13405 / ORS 571) TaxID=438753 RepID=A8HSY9_AZOC5|nr:histidine--tRNA ligase [Azorhizobium caulinodans]BAF90232.1 histidyl-tRNA synthetase [Azorhizobium caulinodans ORS 571]